MKAPTIKEIAGRLGKDPAGITYVDMLIDEWRITQWSPPFQECMRRVLGELDAWAQVILRREPRLEVMSHPDVHLARHYFPQEEGVPAGLTPKPKTEVLLVFHDPVKEQAPSWTDYEIRHGLGHALLYLRNLKVRNTCHRADREWQRCVTPSIAAEIAKKAVAARQIRRTRKTAIEQLESLGAIDFKECSEEVEEDYRRQVGFFCALLLFSFDPVVNCLPQGIRFSDCHSDEEMSFKEATIRGLHPQFVLSALCDVLRGNKPQEPATGAAAKIQ